jgi:hypothetical protein
VYISMHLLFTLIIGFGLLEVYTYIWGLRNVQSFLPLLIGLGLFMFNATLNNISVRSWRLVILVEEIRIPGVIEIFCFCFCRTMMIKQ